MKVSIITACYNSEKTIEETILSILNQDYHNIEYILVDGLSKDNTIDIIKKYEPKFKGKMRYISEKDKGIYDAMNKGIHMATGNIIGLLNSDDVLANNHVISKIVEEFQKTNCDATYSDLLFLDESMKKRVRKFIAHKESKKLGWHPPHPTLYLKRKIYDEIGYFNTNYKIAADYDFMLRMIKSNKYQLSYIKEYLVYMRSGGASTDGLKGYYKSFKESLDVLKNNHIPFPFLVNSLRTIKIMIQSITSKL